MSRDKDKFEQRNWPNGKRKMRSNIRTPDDKDNLDKGKVVSLGAQVYRFTASHVISGMQRRWQPLPPLGASEW